MNNQLHQELHSDCGKFDEQFGSILKSIAFQDPKADQPSGSVAYFRMKLKEIVFLLDDLKTAFEKKNSNEECLDQITSILAEVDIMAEEVPLLRKTLADLSDHLETATVPKK